jgi:hypothetical protein
MASIFWEVMPVMPCQKRNPYNAASYNGFASAHTAEDKGALG